MRFTAIVSRDGGRWTAECLEAGIVVRGDTREGVIKDVEYEVKRWMEENDIVYFTIGE